MSSVTLSRASGPALLLGAVLVIIGLPLSYVFPPDRPMALAMVRVWTGGSESGTKRCKEVYHG